MRFSKKEIVLIQAVIDQSIFYRLAEFFKKLIFRGILSFFLQKYSILFVDHCGFKRTRSCTYDFLQSYLSDRTQFVVNDGKSSDFVTMHAGVPQGSSLGPPSM